MDSQLFNLFQRTFKKIDGLYHAQDMLDLIVEEEGIFDYSYRSTLFSSKFRNEDTDDNCTRIIFFEDPKTFWIGFIAVHPEVRGRGYGRKMVEAVEEIAKERGRSEILVEEVYNPSFWGKMRYSPLIRREDNHEDKWYKKAI